jgi:hypothetical protein
MLAAMLLVAPAHSEESRQVAAGPEYDVGGWFRVLFGDGYRDLWATPVPVPVLDLETENGGLTPVRQIGRKQTPGLALEGANGRSYTFRSLHKHPDRILPPELREGFPGYIVRDATSGTHPAAGLILPTFLDAAGVPVIQPRLVLLPDDATLGPFRETFANELGTFEEYPRAAGEALTGFRNATEILSTDEVWRRRMEGPETRTDSRAYLRVRIVDLWLDNYDRHGGQWRWMRLPGRERLQPLPEDPDMILLHHDGLVKTGLRQYVPRLLCFDSEFPGRLEGPLMNAWTMDRWVLAALDASAFDAIARDVQSRLTDPVIDAALRQMPPEWYAIDGERTREALRARRRKLVDYVMRVYRYYAESVDVHGSDGAETVTVVRSEDDSVLVTVTPDDEASKPHYRRRFEPGETKEVRVYLHGGDDRVEREGPAGGPILVRVIAAGGRNLVDDSESGGTEVWADGGAVDVQRGPGTTVHDGSWVQPEPIEDQPWSQPRSWGHWTVPEALVWWDPDLALLVGGGFTRTSWAFRSEPFKTKQTVRAAFATGNMRGRVEYVGAFRPTGSGLALSLRAYASRIERVNFFGFGNDTPEETERDRYRSQETAALVSPTLRLGRGGNFEAIVGANFRYSRSKEGRDTILGAVRPYGFGNFGSLGVRAGARLDTTERPRYSGVYLADQPLGPRDHARVKLRLDGLYIPAAWDVEEGYGGIDGEAVAFLGSHRAHLALRAGGRRVWGTYAWFDAAFLGGANARAFPSNRFAGDASLYGSAELRVWMGTLTNPVLPVRLGLFALGDVGRVWLDDEDSSTWHASYGGGLLFQPLGFPLTAHATLAFGEEGPRFYLGSGYSF